MTEGSQQDEGPAGAGDGEPGGGLGERLTQQLAHQWALIRAERRAEPVTITTGPSNFSRAQVPWGLDLAAAWSWRILVIAAAGYAIAWTFAYFAVITLPLVIALLFAALAGPFVRLMAGGLPRSLAAGVTVLGGLALVVLLLTFVGQQVAEGVDDLAGSVVAGLGKIRDWLRDGPLGVTDSQLNTWIDQAQRSIAERTREGHLLTQVTEVGTAVGHVLAGVFIVLFASYFFLADGHRIWAWLVRLAPRAAREHVDTSGRVAWISLTQFVRATVIVALADAVGVMVVAAVLGVPFVLAIGVIVFLGAFVPMVGATVAGTVAILVALVDQGPFTALLMLGGVILVQQIEGHILQPFLMGRFVSLHPLGVIVAIGCGVLVAGIAGALIAVPLAAAANAVVQHLAAHTEVGDPDATDDLAEDIEDVGAGSPPVPAEDGIGDEAAAQTTHESGEPPAEEADR
ncbi:AI-2E family transporter [Nocardioides gansuensis]|uniref:AI-2E family transporter n=1 Tax=Nocardioides gansuensis TaxID=2138300 RepID=UPI001FE5618D|nr:AI-2E family transporter [Nocardioides gansuensis]